MPRLSENQHLLVLEGCRLALGWPRTSFHDKIVKHYPVIMEMSPTTLLIDHVKDAPV